MMTSLIYQHRLVWYGNMISYLSFIAARAPVCLRKQRSCSSLSKLFHLQQEPPSVGILRTISSSPKIPFEENEIREDIEFLFSHE